MRSATGLGVRVAVIDSGVNTRHPIFAGRSMNSYWLQGPGSDRAHWAILPDPDATDRLGHGTAVAGLLSAYAPAASIDSIRIFGNGLGGADSRYGVIAIDWAVRQGYDIINCSFGSRDLRYLSDYKTAVDRAFCAGSLIVAACNNRDYRTPELPGAFPTVIATNWGPYQGLRYRWDPGTLVEFVAAGEELRVPWTDGGYRDHMWGSSLAAPHMSAVCARLRELRPGWNAVQVKAFLYSFAETERS
jgi:subtilisin family serine protease